MHNGKYVLAQLLDFIDKDVFLRISNKYNGNRYVKDFTCWNQLAVMVFGQLVPAGEDLYVAVTLILTDEIIELIPVKVRC